MQHVEDLLIFKANIIILLCNVEHLLISKNINNNIV